MQVIIPILLIEIRGTSIIAKLKFEIEAMKEILAAKLLKVYNILSYGCVKTTSISMLLSHIYTGCMFLAA